MEGFYYELHQRDIKHNDLSLTISVKTLFSKKDHDLRYWDLGF